MTKEDILIEFVEDCICGVVVVHNGVEEHYTRQKVLEMFKPNNIKNITVAEEELELIHNNINYTLFGV